MKEEVEISSGNESLPLVFTRTPSLIFASPKPFITRLNEKPPAARIATRKKVRPTIHFCFFFLPKQMKGKLHSHHTFAGTSCSRKKVSRTKVQISTVVMSFSSRNGRKCTSSPFEKGGGPIASLTNGSGGFCVAVVEGHCEGRTAAKGHRSRRRFSNGLLQRRFREEPFLSLCSFGGERGMEASCILLPASHFSLFGFALLFPFSFLPPFFSARSPLASIGRLRGGGGGGGGGGGAGAYWEKEDCTDSTTKKNEEAILLHFSFRKFVSISHSFSPNSLANPVPPPPSLARTTGTTQMLQRSVEPSAAAAGYNRRRAPLLSSPPGKKWAPPEEGGRRPMLPPSSPTLFYEERERENTHSSLLSTTCTPLTSPDSSPPPTIPPLRKSRRSVGASPRFLLRLSLRACRRGCRASHARE